MLGLPSVALLGILGMGWFVMWARKIAVIAGVGVLVYGSLGATCTTLPAEPFVPVSEEVPEEVPGDSAGDIGPPCLVDYWNEEFGVGFDPPPGVAGPFTNESTTPSYLSLHWTLTDAEGTAEALLFSHGSPFNTLEEAAAHSAQAGTWLVFVNEPVRLNSGRPGWVIADKSAKYPDGLMSVEVILIWNGSIHTLVLFGDSWEGTYDYDYLLGIGRTLCAE